LARYNGFNVNEESVKAWGDRLRLEAGLFSMPEAGTNSMPEVGTNSMPEVGTNGTPIEPRKTNVGLARISPSTDPDVNTSVPSQKFILHLVAGVTHVVVCSEETGGSMANGRYQDLQSSQAILPLLNKLIEEEGLDPRTIRIWVVRLDRLGRDATAVSS
jgi:hypothetical protein